MIKARRIAQELYDHHVKTGGKDSARLMESLVEFLNKHHMLSFLPKIIFHLERIIENKKEMEECTVITAHPVNHAAVEHLLQTFVKDSKENQTQVDPDLIGGFKLKHKGIIYDGSLKTKLDLLQAKLSA